MTVKVFKKGRKVLKPAACCNRKAEEANVENTSGSFPRPFLSNNGVFAKRLRREVSEELPAAPVKNHLAATWDVSSRAFRGVF